MATTWTIEDDLQATEDNDWTKEAPLVAKDEDRAWNARDSVLTAGVLANKDKFSGSSNFTVDEILEYPDELDIEPELIQADSDEWTIETEAE